MTDLEFALSQEHEAAMSVRALMTSVSELCEMASTGIGYELVRSDLIDLELAHARLGQLLHALRPARREAA